MSPVETASPRGSHRDPPLPSRLGRDGGATGNTSPRDRIAVAAIVAVAVVARLLVVGATPASTPISDMAEYWLRGVHLYEHGSLYPDSWRMPGLPVWLAALFTLAGGASVDVARLGNLVAGALATLLTWWLARRAGHTSRQAAVAAAVVALYPTLLLYTSLVATEAVVTVPLLGALIALTYSTRRAAVAAGLCTAAALLVRPAAVALVPAALVAVWWAREPGASRTSRVVAFGVALLIAMLPWWSHNASLHRRIVPLDTTGGLNLLIGSGPGANGRWDYARVNELQNTMLVGVDVTTPAGSDRASALAWTHVRTHPLQWLALVPAKLTGLLAFEGRETAYLYSVGFFGAHDALTVGLWAVASVAAFPLLFVIGAWRLARDGAPGGVGLAAGVFLAASALLHLATFGDPRFHLPFVPVMAVLATGPRSSGAAARGWRGLALLVCALMSLAWYAQAVQSMPFIRQLMAPGGWQRPVSFDDLL